MSHNNSRHCYCHGIISYGSYWCHWCICSVLARYPGRICACKGSAYSASELWVRSPHDIGFITSSWFHNPEMYCSRKPCRWHGHTYHKEGYQSVNVIKMFSWMVWMHILALPSTPICYSCVCPSSGTYIPQSSSFVKYGVPSLAGRPWLGSVHCVEIIQPLSLSVAGVVQCCIIHFGEETQR